MANNSYIKLLRINHWFKNIFLLSGVLFAMFISTTYSIGIVFIGKLILAFLLSSLVSSASYIINQITDAKYDALHPIKKNRIIPAGRVSVNVAAAIAFLLFVTSVFVAGRVYTPGFVWSLIGLCVAGLIYNIPPLRLKDVPFIDVISESINNPIRFMIGWYILSWQMPPVGVLILTWCLGAVFMVAKRYDELRHFGWQLIPYRSTFSVYTLSRLRVLLCLYTSLSILLLANNINLFSSISIGIFLIWFINEVVTGKMKGKSIEEYVFSQNFILRLVVITLLVIFRILTR
mgnify:CR=1 FL=1